MQKLTALSKLLIVGILVGSGVTAYRTYGGMLQAKTQSISFAFHRKSTLFLLPPTSWFATILSTGNFDVSPGSGNYQVIAARLEAMRAAACGHEDGAVVGSAPVPPARIVKK